MSAQRSDLEWQAKAACRGPHSSVFYPPDEKSERKDEKRAREARAKEICRTCPVKAPCLEFAISIRETNGIWGGLSESERKPMLAAV